MFYIGLRVLGLVLVRVRRVRVRLALLPTLRPPLTFVAEDSVPPGILRQTDTRVFKNSSKLPELAQSHYSEPSTV